MYKIYVDGQEQPESLQIVELEKLYSWAPEQLAAAESKGSSSVKIRRRKSRMPNQVHLSMPLGECDALDLIERSASGVELRVVVIAEVDHDGDGDADETRDLLEVVIRDVVCVRRRIKLEEALDVLDCLTLSPVRIKRLSGSPSAS